jgi:hypothetical protein
MLGASFVTCFPAENSPITSGVWWKRISHADWKTLDGEIPAETIDRIQPLK